MVSGRSGIERVVRERPERYQRTRMFEMAAAEVCLKGVFGVDGGTGADSAGSSSRC